MRIPLHDSDFCGILVSWDCIWNLYERIGIQFCISADYECCDFWWKSGVCDGKHAACAICFLILIQNHNKKVALFPVVWRRYGLFFCFFHKSMIESIHFYKELRYDG